MGGGGFRLHRFLLVVLSKVVQFGAKGVLEEDTPVVILGADMMA